MKRYSLFFTLASLLTISSSSCDFSLHDEDKSLTVKEDTILFNLGLHLFYDRRLSLNYDRSCGICHEQAKGFTDGFVRGVGTLGDIHPRNTLSLINVESRRSLGWIGPKENHLETQMLTPLFGTNPVEMGVEGVWTERLIELNKDPTYQGLLAELDLATLNLKVITEAITHFERNLLSYQSPYDQYLNGNDTALSPEAKRGLELFEEVLSCKTCHGGLDFDQPNLQKLNIVTDDEVLIRHQWFNTGLYNLAGRYPEGREGLYEVTQNENDIGKYRIPTLRNLSFTAPYYHDGTGATLEDVLKNYNQGGRITYSGPFVGDGRNHPNKHILIQELRLSTEELSDLHAFLLSLNDDSIIQDPTFSDPWPRD